MYRECMLKRMEEMRKQNIGLNELIKYLNYKDVITKTYNFIVHYETSEDYQMYILDYSPARDFKENILYLITEDLDIVPVRDNEDLIEEIAIKSNLIFTTVSNKFLGSKILDKEKKKKIVKKNEMGVFSPIEEVFVIKEDGTYPELLKSHFETKQEKMLTFKGFVDNYLSTYFEKYRVSEKKKNISEEEYLRNELVTQKINKLGGALKLDKENCKNNEKLCNLFHLSRIVFPEYEKVVRKFLSLDENNPDQEKRNRIYYLNLVDEIVKKVENKKIIITNKNQLKRLKDDLSSRIYFLFKGFSANDNVELKKFYIFKEFPEPEAINLDFDFEKKEVKLKFSTGFFSKAKNNKYLVSKNYKNNYTYLNSVYDYMLFKYIVKNMREDEFDFENIFNNKTSGVILDTSFYKTHIEKDGKLVDFEIIPYSEDKFSPDFYLINFNKLFDCKQENFNQTDISVSIKNYYHLLIEIGKILNIFKDKDAKNIFDFLVTLKQDKEDKEKFKIIGGVLYDFLKGSFDSNVDIQMQIENLFVLLEQYRDIMLTDALKFFIKQERKNDSKNSHDKYARQLLSLVYLLISIDLYLKQIKGDIMQQSMDKYFKEFLDTKKQLKQFLSEYRGVAAKKEDSNITEQELDVLGKYEFNEEQLSYAIGAVMKYLFIQKRGVQKIGDLTPLINKVYDFNDVKDELNNLIVAYGYNLGNSHKAIIFSKLVLSLKNFDLNKDFLVMGLLEIPSVVKDMFRTEDARNSENNKK